MKKIGILGGIAWPSTVEYYAGICRLAEQRHALSGHPAPTVMPEMAIESLDLATATALLGHHDDEESWHTFDAYHHEGLRRLERSRVDFAVIACNTAHHRLAQITRGINIPVLNIFDVAAAACARLCIESLLILGTPTVMTSPFLRNVFLRRGIAAHGPRRHGDRQATIAVIEALARGYNEGASGCIHDIVANSHTGRTQRSSAVYLGCTELPLAFAAHKAEAVFESDGIRYINSTALHIQAAFEYAIRGS